MTQHGVKALLTTEKDAVRLGCVATESLQQKTWTLPVEIQWDQPMEVDDFLKSWVQTLPS